MSKDAKLKRRLRVARREHARARKAREAFEKSCNLRRQRLAAREWKAFQNERDLIFKLIDTGFTADQISMMK